MTLFQHRTTNPKFTGLKDDAHFVAPCAMPTLVSSPLVTTLLARSPPPPLTANKVWRTELTPEIDQLNASLNIRAGNPREHPYAMSYQPTVLHLLNDDFDACHSLAQTREGDPYSDHLHCIAHRREPEPDYWSSK